VDVQNPRREVMVGSFMVIAGGLLAVFGWMPFANSENGTMKGLTVVLLGVLLALAGGQLAS
jgi:hypothetical protein